MKKKNEYNRKINICITLMSCTGHLSTYLNTSRCVIVEMLEARGYDVSHISSFVPALANGDTLDSIILENTHEAIEVHYSVSTTRTNHKSISKNVEMIIEKRKKEKKPLKNLTIIFLVCDSITPSVKEAIRVLTHKFNIFIQVFPIRNLMYNVTKHVNVPQHIRIPKRDFDSFGVEDFLDSLHINSLDNLPKILDTDPVAMFIGLQPGELCKVIRPSQSAGKHIVYRYCVREK